MSDLPNWVYDLIMATQEWGDVHPSSKGAPCGCEGLAFVPDDVKAKAQAIAEYKRHEPCHCDPLSHLTPEEIDIIAETVRRRREE
jgi:hypothetical protein